METNHARVKAGLAVVGVLAVLVTGGGHATLAERQRRGAGPTTQATPPALSVVLGRPTDRSIAISLWMRTPGEAFVEYGTTPGEFPARTPTAAVRPGEPVEIAVGGLQPDARYHYRVRERKAGDTDFAVGQTGSFQTRRRPGSPFSFTVQGDSHPERPGRMFDPDLYRRTLESVRRDAPDFHLLLGDDFSVDPLIQRGQLTQSAVDRLYLEQRSFLAIISASVPTFLVNGNHEEAALALFKGAAESAPLFSARARNRYFPLPAPDGFYSGDSEPVEGIGLLRDYYAWSWGDALFVVIDPYWHSPVAVDASTAEAGTTGGRRPAGEGRTAQAARGQQRRNAGGRQRDWWGMTIGDAQYRWLEKTLEESQARFKFVFAHHVLGTGRGGIEMADLYEWGGKDPSGTSRFAEMRPGWNMPIHQLMVRTGVTIFFQGHDHLFARQERDGIVYQEVPNPADPTYTAFNRDAYRSGDVLPNSGHLRVTVSADHARVDYIRSWLSGDETRDRTQGGPAFSYTVKPRAAAGRR